MRPSVAADTDTAGRFVGVGPDRTLITTPALPRNGICGRLPTVLDG